MNHFYGTLFIEGFKPSTKVGTAKLKQRIKKRGLREFSNAVVNFNTWFKAMKITVTTEEREGYNRYFRQLFSSHQECNNAKFLVSVEDEE